MRSLEQKKREELLGKETTLIYKGRIITLELLAFSTGKTFEIVKRDPAVVILPILPDGKILLIQQWRRAAAEIMIELPAGIIEKGEDPLTSAQRELREETGYRANRISPLGGFYSTPGFCNEYLHLFLAEDLHLDPLPPDEGECIDLMPVTPEEAKQLIAKNQIRDAKTVAGVLRYLCL